MDIRQPSQGGPADSGFALESDLWIEVESAMLWISVFVVSFVLMELVAWALHRYVMHGFLWSIHEDHHNPVKGQTFQKNDLFAFAFAVPSFFAILFGSLYKIAVLEAAGYGVTAYGIAYFFVHEVIIHRRWQILNVKNTWYVEAIRVAHHHHHSVRGKDGASNFGMLYAPPKYFKTALKDISQLRKLKNS